MKRAVSLVINSVRIGEKKEQVQTVRIRDSSLNFSITDSSDTAMQMRVAATGRFLYSPWFKLLFFAVLKEMRVHQKDDVM